MVDAALVTAKAMQAHTESDCAPADAPQRPAIKPRRFLVAEDDPSMRRLIAATLRKDGDDVLEAGGGAALLEWAEHAVGTPSHRLFDAIISDIQMPDLTALDVLRRVPAVSRSAPVILITGAPHKSICDDAYDLGARLVLRKPIEMDDLRAAVRSVVRHWA